MDKKEYKFINAFLSKISEERGYSDYPMLEEDTDGKRTFYIYGTNGLLSKETVEDGQPDKLRYVINDHLGSTRLLLDENAEKIKKYDCDAYGYFIKIFL